MTDRLTSLTLNLHPALNPVLTLTLAPALNLLATRSSKQTERISQFDFAAEGGITSSQ